MPDERPDDSSDESGDGGDVTAAPPAAAVPTTASPVQGPAGRLSESGDADGSPFPMALLLHALIVVGVLLVIAMCICLYCTGRCCAGKQVNEQDDDGEYPEAPDEDVNVGVAVGTTSHIKDRWGGKEQELPANRKDSWDRGGALDAL